jgi:hypothetical protein
LYILNAAAAQVQLAACATFIFTLDIVIVAQLVFLRNIHWCILASATISQGILILIGSTLQALTVARSNTQVDEFALRYFHLSPASAAANAVTWSAVKATVPVVAGNVAT